MERGNTKRLTRNDALTFLYAVKKTFHDNTPTYGEFLNVMKDFKARRIDVAVVIKRVKELFKDRQELLIGFSLFLPRGYEILLPLNQDPSQMELPSRLDEAIKYIMKVKTRFEGDDRVYKSFLDIMAAYGERSSSIGDVFEQVCLLFMGHADLIIEFFSYLPIQGRDDGH